MRFSYIALAALAMAALVSCQENEISYNTLEKGEVGFYLKGARATKADMAPVTTEGVTIELGSDEFGHRFFLEQTVTNLDAIVPETKGTPAYSENVVTLYDGKFNATVYSGSSVFDSNGEFVYDESLKAYTHMYGNDLWDNTPVTFYMWMPGALNDAVGVSNLSFADKKISFSYDGSKLANAAAMTDLLFTSRSFKDNKGTPNDPESYNQKEGAEVLFHHALTGVKFASSNTKDDDAKIKITEVILKGIKDKGNCVVTPQPENEKYEDDPEIYSSAAAVAWSNLSVSSEDAAYTSGELGAPRDYTSGENDPFGSSFYNGGNTRNLNDENATQTFWIIPQEMTADVKVTIKYTVNDEEGEWDLDLGTYISKKSDKKVEFKAGELYTFYVRLDDVNVMIEDEVSDTVKDAVEITNTGTVDSYIRASIVGQWLDKDGNPVFGFTDYISEYEEVPSWYQDQFITGNHSHGEFLNLAGYDQNNPYNDWLLCSDGYYYYTEVVAPGDQTSTLFDSYTILMTPEIKINDVVQEVHFQLEISTQAVSAKRQDTSTYDWDEAWERALGAKPVKKTN